MGLPIIKIQTGLPPIALVGLILHHKAARHAVTKTGEADEHLGVFNLTSPKLPRSRAYTAAAAMAPSCLHQVTNYTGYLIL